MIHVKVSPNPDPELVNLQISFVGKPEIQKFYDLIQRSLNCAPDFGEDWFKLSDGIEKLLNNK